MARQNTISFSPTAAEISPVDALWVLIQGQTKAVRKALTKRLIEDEQIAKAKQETMVKETLTRAFDELHAGKVYDDARSLFDD
jgi:hypothetical protein